jgi:multimeric flavodoxin WrbA
MTIKALGICGSPRLEGNTATLVRRCLSGLAERGIETEYASLAGKTLRGCTACGKCSTAKNRQCIEVTDDDFPTLFDSILDADIIVVGSPVYFGSATPELMALLDRAGYVARANGNLLSRKLGGPIAIARRAGHNFTYAQLMFWYTINDMIVPGSTYWNVGLAREAGAIERDQEALATIDRFAENLAWLAEKVHG